LKLFLKCDIVITCGFQGFDGLVKSPDLSEPVSGSHSSLILLDAEPSMTFSLFFDFLRIHQGLRNMIIFTHHTGEPHGILGAQAAATFLQRKLSIPSIVVGIERAFSKEQLFRFIDEYYAGKWSPAGKSTSSIQGSCGATSRSKNRACTPKWLPSSSHYTEAGVTARRRDYLLPGEKVVAFSHLCGRIDIIELIQEIKQKGFITILGGPQARKDYDGEPNIDSYPHRFKGLKSVIDIAFQGPVDGFRSEYLSLSDRVHEHPWAKNIFLEVDWSNIYTFSDTLKKLEVQLGQVLNAIGCPYASKLQTIILPPPVNLRERGIPDLEARSEGCIFCDISKDKGYHGSIERDRIITQILGLPEIDGRKIPFELIDEYPIRSLGKLLEDTEKEEIKLSQINLVCRVDDINAHASDLVEILSLARRQDVKIMFASIGFESFCDQLLQYFCKGITMADIVKCVKTLRRLKDRFGSHFLYRRDEGANHGFIRPTPWDDSGILQEIDTNIFLHRFYEDILPEHSTPLIIHHASYLGDWIRQIESMADITFSRDGTWIEWWNPSPRGNNLF